MTCQPYKHIGSGLPESLNTMRLLTRLFSGSLC